jgi:hypothetical protein
MSHWAGGGALGTTGLLTALLGTGYTAGGLLRGSRRAQWESVVTVDGRCATSARAATVLCAGLWDCMQASESEAASGTADGGFGGSGAGFQACPDC